jgi:hypothetical protein
MKWNDNKAEVKFDITQVRTGHKAHRAGAGTHDSRPNRQRTRRDAARKAIRDYD